MTLTRHDADIAVAGAGPSGSWAAWRLARGGARVLIFDPSHPREKPCGGGVTGRALALVAPALDGPLPSVRVRAARFVDSQRGTEASVPLQADGRDLAVVSRRVFDAALVEGAQRAGAVLIRERVASIEAASGEARLQTASGRTFRARIVIGADGANSLVRRRLSHAFTRAQLSIATGFFARESTDHDVVIEFVDDPPGYIWSFPRPDHLSVGVCAQADCGVTPERLRAIASSWLARSGLVPTGTRLEPYSWPIPSLSAKDLQRLDPAGPGWLLTGDAAGLVDPITREGIFFALQSADEAASAILSDASRPEDVYAAAIRRSAGAELARAARLKAGFFRPRFTRLLLHALTCGPSVRGIMADLVAGTQSYAGLKWRLLSTLEWRLAWQLLTLERGGAPADADYFAR